jgi:transcriptional regulator with XRE-family HTH domain
MGVETNIMNMKINDVEKRFVNIIMEHPPKWWSEKLGVSPGVVSNSWKSGNMPRPETLFKIFKVKGISPNWFFFNIEPKSINDVDGVAADPLIQHGRKTHQKILEKENELFNLQDEVKYLRTSLKLQEMSRLIPLSGYGGDVSLDIDGDLFKNHILPIITLMRLLNEILFKALEYLTKSDLDNEKLDKIIDWITSNFESEQFTAIAALKNIDKLI